MNIFLQQPQIPNYCCNKVSRYLQPELKQSIIIFRSLSFIQNSSILLKMEVRHQIAFSYHKNILVSVVCGKGMIRKVQRQTDLQSKEQKKFRA